MALKVWRTARDFQSLFEAEVAFEVVGEDDFIAQERCELFVCFRKTCLK